MALVSFWWDLLVVLHILIIGFYLYVKHAHGYWKRKGLFYLEPTFFIGNQVGFNKSFTLQFSDMYFNLKSKPYAGYYMILRPGLLVNDLDQIKNILVKDFVHFMDHSVEMNEKYDPVVGHLFNLTGEKWKNLRIKITPTFTTTKMKYMFDSINSCADTMMEYLNDNFAQERTDDVKEILAKFSTDVIGCCAFGIECNSFKDPNSKFRKMGKKIFKLPLYRKLLSRIMLFFFPGFLASIKFSLLGKEINDFFCNLVKDTVEYREKNNIVRNDFLQLLMDLNKENPSDDNKNSTYFD